MDASLLFKSATPSAVADTLEGHGAVARPLEYGTDWCYPSTTEPLAVIWLRSDLAGSRELCVGTLSDWIFEFESAPWWSFEERLGWRPTVHLSCVPVSETANTATALRGIVVALLAAHDGIVEYRHNVCTSEEVRARGDASLTFMDEL